MSGGDSDGESEVIRRSVAQFGSGGDTRIVDDAATLKALYDPLRFRIVGLLDQPRSVKEIAEELDRKPSGLYHHVKLLEDHGLIRVAEERLVGRRLERLYVRSASKFETAEELSGLLADVIGDSATRSAVGHLRRALQPEGKGEQRRTRFVADFTTRLRPEEAERLGEAIRQFLDERVARPATRRRRARDDETVEYRLLISMAPTESEREPEPPSGG